MRATEFITEGKIKGVDGKACWKGKRYAGRVKKADGTYKDKCVPVGEELDEAGSPAQQAAIAIAMKKAGKKPKSESLTLDQQFDMIEEMIDAMAQAHGVDPDLVWEDFESVDDEDLYALSEDWQKVNKRDKTDGMSRKAVKAYRRENPGSKLKTAVTTKPSKLKKGSKSAKRRKSFCARMSGMKKAHASAKTKRDPDSPINKALRRWNC